MAAVMDQPRGWRPPWELSSLLGLFALFLSPALGTGYYAEDLIHSMTPGIARVEGLSILGQLVSALRYNIETGRFYPVTNLLHVGVHALARDVLTYKTILLAGTVFDMLLFYLLVRRLTEKSGFACLAACLTVSLVQFRIHPDPVLGYYLQIQLVTAGLFASLHALLFYLEGRGKVWLAASAASYLLIAMTYEITYPFFATHLLLIWRGRQGGKARLAAALPILGVVFACGLSTLVVRLLSKNQNHYVHKLDFDAAAYLTAIWHQVSAALPMAYLLGDSHSVFHHLKGVADYGRWALQPMAIVVALAALGFAFRALRKPGNRDGCPADWSLVTLGLGLLLVLLPTVLIASSPFHQTQFRFGVGWVPVLIECYGMGLVLATLLWWMISLRPLGGSFAPWKCAGVAVLIAAVTGLTYRANEEVAACLNAPWGTPDYRERALSHSGQWDQQRRLLESALRSGLMKGVPRYSVVLLANQYPNWQTPLLSMYFYAAYTAKVLVTVAPSAQAPSSPDFALFREFLEAHRIKPCSDRAYGLRDVSLDRKSGYVVLWRVDREASVQGGDAEYGEFRLFVKHPGLFRDGETPAFRVVIDRPAGEGKPGTERIEHPGKDLAVIRSGRDWGLYSLRSWRGWIDPNTLRVEFDAGASRPEEAIRNALLAPEGRPSVARGDSPGSGSRAPRRRAPEGRQ